MTLKKEATLAWLVRFHEEANLGLLLFICVSLKLTVECFPRFCFVVKTSADNVILQFFDIFSHEFSLFSTQLTLFSPKKLNWIEKRLNSCEKMSKICKIILSADVLHNDTKPWETFHCAQHLKRTI